jgi:transposase
MSLLIPFGLPGCTIDAVQVDAVMVSISAHTTGLACPCPTCGSQSESVHSYYTRTLRDVPISNQPIRLLLTVRRFRCRNAQCTRQTFAEPLPTIAPVFARRTLRFTHALQQIGFTTGGEAGARLGDRLGLPTSPDTMLRVLHRTAHPHPPTPRVVGVDDWALAKGRDYPSSVKLGWCYV